MRDGQLLVNNTAGSGTGIGPVFVNGGTLGGAGSIAGVVTIGKGSGRVANIAPGNEAGGIGTLTIRAAIVFLTGGTYSCELDSSDAVADSIVANGVTIDSGASFSLITLQSGTLTAGTVFTVINNTSANPISGTFANLPDNAVITAGGNNLQVSYEGGDGNDLTLTVVP